MDYQKKINSQHEIVHPIIIWIIASILFHLLLALGIITLKISSLPPVSLKKETQDRAILMMDEPKKQKTQTQPPPVQPTAPQKKEKKSKEKEEPKLKWSDYTLIPGRQGINKQNIDDPKNLSNLPKPEDQKLEQKVNKLKDLDSRSKPGMTNTEKIKNEQSKTVNSKKKSKEKHLNETTQQSESKNITPDKNESVSTSAFEQESKSLKQKSQPITQFTDQDRKKASIKEKLKKEFHTPIAEQDPYEFVPEPSRIVSFQDLNLGFDNHYATVGNNANLIQQGITSAVPDGASLKHLTYYNQCAEMMKNEIRTHPQIRLCQNVFGKNLVCAVTVDRQGHQLEFRMLQGSGNIILDRVIQESIMAVKMFPKVPTFIPDSPFVMRWRWYF
ncbi:hypothetical protein KBB68_03010 [Candidatus Babeliales bacterium]|nr:hypothetical protein [Candidatus Babeliales bacterium]